MQCTEQRRCTLLDSPATRPLHIQCVLSHYSIKGGAHIVPLPALARKASLRIQTNEYRARKQARGISATVSSARLILKLREPEQPRPVLWRAIKTDIKTRDETSGAWCLVVADEDRNSRHSGDVGTLNWRKCDASKKRRVSK